MFVCVYIYISYIYIIYIYICISYIYIYHIYIYPLVICYIAIENGPVEIVDLPSKHGEFPVRFLRTFTRPGKPPFSIIFPWFSHGFPMGFPIKTSIFRGMKKVTIHRSLGIPKKNKTWSFRETDENPLDWGAEKIYVIFIFMSSTVYKTS